MFSNLKKTGFYFTLTCRLQDNFIKIKTRQHKNLQTIHTTKVIRENGLENYQNN